MITINAYTRLLILYFSGLTYKGLTSKEIISVLEQHSPGDIITLSSFHKNDPILINSTIHHVVNNLKPALIHSRKEEFINIMELILKNITNNIPNNIIIEYKGSGQGVSFFIKKLYEALRLVLMKLPNIDPLWKIQLKDTPPSMEEELSEVMESQAKEESGKDVTHFKLITINKFPNRSISNNNINVFLLLRKDILFMKETLRNKYMLFTLSPMNTEDIYDILADMYPTLKTKHDEIITVISDLVFSGLTPSDIIFVFKQTMAITGFEYDKHSLFYILSNMDNVSYTENTKKINFISNKLRESIFSQDHAIDMLVKTLGMAELSIQSEERPFLVAMFTGPTGTGKTFFTNLLAKYYTGYNPVRIDMSEFTESHSISRIIGSPPGYVGYTSESTTYVKQLKNLAKPVLLLDEIEKAHPDIYNLFLNVIDTGILTLSNGDSVNLTNAIIIMTSNITMKISKTIGFETNSSGKVITARNKILASKHFSPEFINRIDEIIEFNSLPIEAMSKIAKRELNQLIIRLNIKNITLTYDHDVLETIANLSDPKMGGRDVLRIIQRIKRYIVGLFLDGRIASINITKEIVQNVE